MYNKIKLYAHTVQQLIVAINNIPAGVTTLNLSGNEFHLKTAAELASAFSGIPPHIKTIDLRNNKLFINKSTLEKDEILQALGKDRGRFILADNGESDLARALAPMVALTYEKKLPIDVAGHILSFLPTISEHQPSQEFYTKQLKDTERHIDEIREERKERKESIIAANTAITNYLSWSKGENNLRGLNGFFTWIRHGQAGRERAEALRDKINRGDSSAIKEFLKHPETRYHRHSLASFLLDELFKIKDSSWEKTNDYPRYKP